MLKKLGKYYQVTRIKDIKIKRFLYFEKSKLQITSRTFIQRKKNFQIKLVSVSASLITVKSVKKIGSIYYVLLSSPSTDQNSIY